jgi:thioredoxin reductase (NADPH)
LQAHKFGVRVKLGSRAVALSARLDTHQVRFEDGELVIARSVIIATGARYNRLQVDRLAEFEGVGVYYAATQMEAQACTGRPVVIVGGGNSAGQAALFLARTCTEVHLVIRGQTLASSMSRYLIERIEQAPRIHVVYRTGLLDSSGSAWVAAAWWVR